jgi:RNA methyltransferase, TrmH family
LGSNPLVLVAESVEKPGNLGAMFRTVDAAGVDTVLVCDSGTDIFNPNVVRSSLGTLFTSKVVCCSSKEAISWLKDMNIKIFTTALTASRPYHLIDYRGPSAIVAGAEATGVSAIWEDNSDANIIIPMFGKVDSLNVSAAASIIIYEALRQRGLSHGTAM